MTIQQIDPRHKGVTALLAPPDKNGSSSTRLPALSSSLRSSDVFTPQFSGKHKVQSQQNAGWLARALASLALIGAPACGPVPDKEPPTTSPDGGRVTPPDSGTNPDAIVQPDSPAIQPDTPISCPPMLNEMATGAMALTTPLPADCPPPLMARQVTVTATNPAHPNDKRLITLPFMAPIDLNRDLASQIRLSMPVLDPATQTSRLIDIPIDPASVQVNGNQGTQLTLQARTAITAGARLTLPAGLIRQRGGNADATMAELTLNIADGNPAYMGPKAVGLVLQNPRDIDRFTVGAYPASTPSHEATDPGWSDSETFSRLATQLQADMNRIYTADPERTQKVQRLMDLYNGVGDDGTNLRRTIPNHRLRAGLLYNAGGPGEDTIDAVLTDIRNNRFVTPEGVNASHAPIDFSTLTGQWEGYNAVTFVFPNGSTYMVFNDAYRFENEKNWAEVFVHEENAHRDRDNNITEEIVAHALQARIRINMLNKYPDLVPDPSVQTPTELTRRLNTLALAFIMSGQNGFPTVGGIDRSPNVDCVYPGQTRTDRPDFRTSITAANSTLIPTTASPTPGNIRLNTIISRYLNDSDWQAHNGLGSNPTFADVLPVLDRGFSISSNDEVSTALGRLGLAIANPINLPH